MSPAASGTTFTTSAITAGVGSSIYLLANTANTFTMSQTAAIQVIHEIPINFTSSQVLVGQTACNVVTYTATITGITLISDISGGATLDIRTTSYQTYLQGGPSEATTITASDTPTFSGAFGYSDTTLTGWTKPIAASVASPVVVCAVLSSPSSIHFLAGKLTLVGSQ